MATHYKSWGNFPKTQQELLTLRWRHQFLPEIDPNSTLLPYGLGRSYGDVCLNDGGYLLPTRHLIRFINFDEKTGLLRCEAGVSLAEILDFCVPLGWFLPTTPGTKFVTLGGAIANDVHGKNHHQAGTFGRHVTQFELLTSDGERRVCSPKENMELYQATIGGLGLTGLMTWVELQLRPIHHRAMRTETIKFGNLEEFFSLSAASDVEYEYTMAWVDCSSKKKKLGRGIFFRGNHLTAEEAAEVKKNWKPPLLARLPPVGRTMPFNLPGFALNRWSVQVFNNVYYHKQRQSNVSGINDYDPFFYPLDAILEWNRLYGRSGFLQYQFVVPYEDHNIIKEILQTIANSGLNSFLAVLKTFGDIDSPGLLSFPRKGITLALDFPVKGADTFELLDYLDEQVLDAGGVLYPCKDARMSAKTFQTCYPQWTEFAQYIDPRFSSSFWRRVTRG